MFFSPFYYLSLCYQQSDSLLLCAIPLLCPASWRRKKGDPAHTVIGALSFTFNFFEVTGREKRTINRLD
jgi:hypothetical protein